VLTRDFLQKADCKTAFGAIEESLLLTPEQRAASLACTLSRRPDHSPVWVFGYGSLMWNPVFESEEVRPAILQIGCGKGDAAQVRRNVLYGADGDQVGGA